MVITYKLVGVEIMKRGRKIVKERRKMLIWIILIALGLILFFLWQNNHIVVSRIDYKNPKLPEEFKGYKIVHISDLHNKSFGKDQEKLLRKIREEKPDIIVITGDLIDRRRYDLDAAMVFVQRAMDIGQLYYVSGNHEAWSGDYENIRKKLIDSEVVVLDNEKVSIERGESTLEILGLLDPGFYAYDWMDGENFRELEEALKIMAEEDKFQILLSHRPELFPIYIDAKIDLIFSGHAHGGQFRIPFIGGLIAPNQGFFPDYTEGSHRIEDSTLVVSRGLGNSIVPIRIFNRPEILVVELNDK